jgi:RimJ/RimL family protein N-acetyltransferase
VAANVRSVRVMEKLGMRFSGEFEHPAMVEGHPLRRHVLYRVRTHLSQGT